MGRGIAMYGSQIGCLIVTDMRTRVLNIHVLGSQSAVMTKRLLKARSNPTIRCHFTCRTVLYLCIYYQQ